MNQLNEYFQFRINKLCRCAKLFFKKNTSAHVDNFIDNFFHSKRKLDLCKFHLS